MKFTLDNIELTYLGTIYSEDTYRTEPYFLCTVSKNRVLLGYEKLGSNSGLYLQIVDVKDTMSQGTALKLESNIISGTYATTIDDNKCLLFVYPYTEAFSSYVITINTNGNITAKKHSKDAEWIYWTTSDYIVNLIGLDTDKALLYYTNQFSRIQMLRTVNISGDNVTYGTETAFSLNGTKGLALAKINSNKAFIGTYSDAPQGIICNINDDTLTLADSVIDLSSYYISGSGGYTPIYINGNIYILSNVSYVLHLIEIQLLQDDKMIIISDNVVPAERISYANVPQIPAIEFNGNIVTVVQKSSSDASGYGYLIALDTDIRVKKVQSLSDKIAGIAKKYGIEGQVIDVYVPKI